MTNKEALTVISGIIDKYNGLTNFKDPVKIGITNEDIVAFYKVDYILRKLIHMADNLAEEYVDLTDVDYPPRDDFWDGYNKGYHDCEVELQAKEKNNDGSDKKQSGKQE